MYTPEARAALSKALLDRAASDPQICAAAVTGSAASDREDRWSDIDLAFAVANEGDLGGALSNWTAFMYARHAALHHLDIKFGAWVYRVFLLASTLQVDLAFVPSAEFRPLSASFRLVFGHAQDAKPALLPHFTDLVGFGWLYALHVRSCIARGRRWQALYMIDHMRDTALELACLRHGLANAHGRSFDLLPEDILRRYNASLIQKLDAHELAQSFAAVTESLLMRFRLSMQSYRAGSVRC